MSTHLAAEPARRSPPGERRLRPVPGMSNRASASLMVPAPAPVPDDRPFVPRPRTNTDGSMADRRRSLMDRLGDGRIAEIPILAPLIGGRVGITGTPPPRSPRTASGVPCTTLAERCFLPRRKYRCKSKAKAKKGVLTTIFTVIKNAANSADIPHVPNF